MFQDEAGFGRINHPKYCWCEKGIRPSVPCHHIREYRYAYGAVEPLTGESCFLVMSYCNTACMNLFLRELSEQFPLDTMNAEIVICLSISLLYHTRRYLAPFSVRYCSKISQPEFLTRLEIRFSSNSSIWSELQQILSVRTDLSQIYTQIYR